MPYKAEELSVNRIESDSDLSQAVASFDTVVGIDSEFKRTNTFYPIPALYQVASQKEIFLIDPLSIQDWSPFIDFLEDRSYRKIFHACQEDLELLASHMSVVPKNVFDTQFAYAFLSDAYSLSYANLVEEMLGVSLQKNETRSDWLQRPLTSAQVEYAVEDVLYLVDVYRSLEKKLEEKKRLDWVAEDNDDRTVYKEVEPSEYYRNIKRAWQLEGKSLAILKDLGEWREMKARSANIPRRRVIWDEHLVDFAKNNLLTEQEIREALPSSLVNEYGGEILQAYQKGASAEHPGLIARPLSGHQNRVVKQLREVALTKAQNLGFSVELIGRKKDLEELVRNYEANRELSDYYVGWREEIVASEFLAILSR